MQIEVVSIDLETTGLDTTSDRIIEIGAVKFRGDEIIEQWQTLVYPGTNIPPFVTRLTGLRNQDVEGAPRFTHVLPRLKRFVGTAPIVGHNVRFDLAMLHSHGFRHDNPVIDTYTLASVLMPSTPRYNLTALSTLLEISTGQAHRALDDAQMTQYLLIEFYQRALYLPLATLQEIVRAGQHIPWGGGYFFEQVLKDRVKTAFADSSETPDWLNEDAGYDYENEAYRLKRSKKIKPVDADEVASFIEPGGPMSKTMSDFEYRPQQVDMIHAVADSFNEGRHTIIEAPTGVGKSLGYLLPAIHFAVSNEARVVVSTNTINLQEQLLLKDIPMLHNLLDVDFRAAVLKGRSNYLCPRRMQALRRRGPTSEQEIHMMAKLLVWLSMNQSGDRGDLTLRGPDELSVWYRLSAEDEGCTMQRCADHMHGACPYYRARKKADSAHIVIVNHSLLLSDAVAEGRVLPEYSFLVVDEAHHLEGAVTNSLSFRTDPDAIARQLANLGDSNSGLLGDLLERSRGVLPTGYYDTLSDYVDVVGSAAHDMRYHVDEFFKSIRVFLRDNVRIPRNEYTQQIRILPIHRRNPGWVQVETRWGNLQQYTSAIADAMSKLVGGLAELEEFGIEDHADLEAGAASAARHLTDLHERFHELVEDPDSNTIYWAEFQPDGRRFSLHAAPLEVGPMVREHIWNQKEAVVMTSATLRTDHSFDYVRARWDAEDAAEVVIDTPFDYETSTLLYVVNDIPEPGDQYGFQKAVEAGILDLCLATEGRAMVLFTSFAQLRQTASAIGDDLAAAGITLYDQSDGVSRLHLLEGFVQTEKAVLMGTRSFWEGVDVPGADLSALIIVRLPFSVPSDPLYAARSETFENSFNQYAVPEAILRFRQGFGRLIRRQSDHGIVAIFDRRIISKQYGRQFMASLPGCTIKQGRMVDLPLVARQWLARG